MPEQFYICREGAREGPFDLLAMLRKIRGGMLPPSSLIARSEHEPPVAAAEIPALMHFFQEVRREQQEQSAPSLKKALTHQIENAVQMVMAEPGLCAIAGGIVLVTFMVSFIFYTVLGGIGAFVSGCFTLFFLQNLFIAVTLRLNRGQRLSASYLQATLTPALGALTLGSLLMAPVVAAGLALFAIPGLFIMSLLSFFPLAAVDRGLGTLPALRASILQVRSATTRQRRVLFIMHCFYLCSAALILPIPFLLPVYAVVLADLYDHSLMEA